MEEMLVNLADQGALLAYLSIFGILLISGFGAPIPEDVPLLVAGYLAGIGVVNPWIMFPGTFLAIVGSDGIVFFLGRRYGHHVPRLPVLRRFLTEARLGKTEAALHKHGGKFIFMARFLPGLRTPAFFTAGGFKMPYWKFLLFDGSAAAISVPTIMLLAFVFAERIDQVRGWVAEGQMVAIGAVVALIAGFIGVKLLLKKRMARPATDPGA